MHFKLWKHVLLSLVLPGVLALGVALYAIYSIDRISYRVSLIEVADDINLNLLELRRYEKNILLLYEESNVRTFHQYLAQIEARTNAKRSEILAILNPEDYDALLDDYRTYRETAAGIIQCVELKKKLLEDIRPLGRAVERDARDRAQALELRRFEKNYLIYREAQALERLRHIAQEMLARQPGIEPALGPYLKAIAALADNQAVKDALVEKIRETGRRIEAITARFSTREREEITRTITASKKLFVASFLLLVGSIAGVAFLITRSVLGSLKSIERSFGDLSAGDFSHGVELSAHGLPDEVHSFVAAYNSTVRRLGAVQGELKDALERLAEANRELVGRQDELVEARKTSAMRLLAAEIVHEINNPLTSVAIFLGGFYEDFQDDPARKANVALMLNEIRRCQSVLRELVDFARRDPLNLEVAQPAALVRDACEVVRAQNRGADVRLDVDLAGLPEAAVLDRVLVYQALVNVLANAFHFSPPGGVIDIRGAGDEGSFSITVADRGVGIPPENLPFIFRPFFTTRKEIGGTGLGLAITKKIVERHGGRITVESVPGAGTSFTIVVPLRREESDGTGAGC
ncbi:MAG TPA: ATP-binding protein [bacterium]